METIHEIKTTFELYDNDGSGYISRDELSNALRQLSFVRPTQEEIDRTLREADLNLDGLISLVEFAEMMGFREEVSQWQKHFKSADADASGSVDQSELSAVLREAGSPNPEAEAADLFTLGGKLPEDILNFDEFVSLAIFKSPLKRKQAVLVSVVLEDAAKSRLKDLFQKSGVQQGPESKDFLTRAQVHTVLRQELNHEVSEKEARSLFKKAGVKETEASSSSSSAIPLVQVVDVEVNFHQFVEIMRLSIQLEKYRDEFKAADQKGAGKLGEESLVLLLKGLGAKSPKRETRRLLKTKDGARKGLTLDKFIEQIFKHNLVG